jgi:hypothetical protein
VASARRAASRAGFDVAKAWVSCYQQTPAQVIGKRTGRRGPAPRVSKRARASAFAASHVRPLKRPRKIVKLLERGSAMKPGHELLGDQLEKYEQQLGGLNSYVRELKAKASEHGTAAEQYDADLLEAEHNIEYYKAEIARVKGEMGNPPGAGGGLRTGTNPPRAGSDSILPRTAKQGAGSFIVSAVSFVAGALVGSKLKSRKGGQEGKG